MFQITAAPSTRVRKSESKRQRSLSSPFPAKRRPSARPTSSPSKSSLREDADGGEEEFTDRLDDHGVLTALATDLRFRDVPQQMQYAQDHMFDSIPEAGGFNSTRIAELLNSRKNLPPIVTVAHVHALSKSPTATDREISELVRKGVLRRITIPGRGMGRSSIGESLVLSDRWIAYVEQLSSIEVATRQKYITALRERPGCSAVAANHFTPAEAATLIRAGLLTAASTASSGLPNVLGFDRSTTGTLASLSTAGSRAAAGSLGAVGGAGAFYDAGGGGGSGLEPNAQRRLDYGPELNFTLPSVGPYLRLLEAARNHLVTLLSKSKFKEAPIDLLRERWDGASTEKQRRGKGLEGVILPAKTKRWKQLYGLRFQWVLEECMGTGLVEVFETGSVGQGVRLT